jgi:hypothetical protein
LRRSDLRVDLRRVDARVAEGRAQNGPAFIRRSLRFLPD